MRPSFKHWAFIAVTGVCLNAKANVFGDFIVGGNACNRGNTSIVENGSDLAVIFDDFNIDMDAGSFRDGLNARKTCTLRVKVTPPRGFYLARLTQVYQGGIIKSSDTSARLNIRYNLGSNIAQPLPVIWPRGQVINPEDFDSVFEETYDSLLAVHSCGGSTLFGMNLVLAGSRDDHHETLVVGVDSVDVSLKTQLKLLPEFRACR